MYNEMRAKIVCGVFVLGSLCWSQTASDLTYKYHAVTSYEVSPHVVMTASFSADGQVCEMVVEKRIKSKDGLVFKLSFSKAELKELVNNLVPESNRGKNLTEPFNTFVDGDFMTTIYQYEKVVVKVHGLIRPGPPQDMVIIINWPSRQCAIPKIP